MQIIDYSKSKIQSIVLQHDKYFIYRAYRAIISQPNRRQLQKARLRRTIGEREIA